MSANNFDQFQDDIVARLRSDPFFDTILIIEERKGTVATKVAAALKGELPYGGKYGAFLVVEIPSAAPEPNLPGPQYLYTCVIHTRVIPRFNDAPSKGTLKQAGTIAERVDALLHNFQNYKQAFQVAHVAPFSDEDGTLGFDHEITWHLGLDPVQPVAMPAASDDGQGTITLACDTDGAAIYYTTDESFPWIGDAAHPSTATLYTGPFAVSSGTLVRAAAYLTGWVGSGVLNLFVEFVPVETNPTFDSTATTFDETAVSFDSN